MYRRQVQRNFCVFGIFRDESSRYFVKYQPPYRASSAKLTSGESAVSGNERRGDRTNVTSVTTYG